MITAVFTSGFDHTDVSGLWQYDYGQKLRIQGLNLPPAVEIHFSLSKSGGNSERRVGVTKDGVTDVPIPDSMLENGGTIQNYYIYAFIYLTDEASGKTVKWIQLHVTSRPKPEAFDSPEEKELFRDAIAAVNESAGKAETSEKSAEAWAHGHEDYPERDEDNAKYYADKAGEKAEETDSNLQKVSNLSNQVKENAETVASDKSVVEEYKNEAGESAENAASSAENAKDSQSAAETAQRVVEELKEHVEKDKEEILLAKTSVGESEKNVTENKEYVRQTVENFTSLAENAVDAVNTAGQNQVNNIEEAGQAALDNISTGVDEGLTQSGKAADAKVTGEKLTGLEHDVEELNNKKITKFYASNLGNTNLKDSDFGKITDMLLYGNSEQKQYSGKNLCNVTLKDQKISGVAFKVNEDKSITVNGTCTNDIYINIGVALLDANVEYKISGCPKFTTWNDAGFYVNANALSGNVWDRGETSTFIMQNTQKYICTIQLRKDVVLNNIIFYPMIRPSSITDSTYEPYVGGIPSPNPDYPQEIKSVVNPVVKVCGKNYLNKLNTYGRDGVDCTYNGDGTYTLSGTASNTVVLSSNLDIELESGYYHLFGCPKNGSSSTYKIDVTDTYSSFITDFGDGDVKYIEKGTYNFRIVVYSGVNVDGLVFKPVLCSENVQEASLQYTLNAIPVSSGGNVTIDGQQYIADYVDVERKKLVRNVRRTTLTSLSSLPVKVQGKNGEYHYSFGYEMKDALKTMLNIQNGAYVYLMCENTRIVQQFSELEYSENIMSAYGHSYKFEIRLRPLVDDYQTLEELNAYLKSIIVIYPIEPTTADLTDEEVREFIELATYYPTTNVMVTSDQLNGYTEFNYPLNMKNGWDYVMEQIEETRPIIYDTEVKVLENRIDTAILAAMMEG